MLNTIFNKISKCCCIISILALCACIVVNAYEIFCRNFLAKSLYWIQDWTSFCMVWFVSFGMITITWEKKDIYIELILEKLPEKLQRVIRICICVLTIAFCSFVATRILAYMKLNVGKYMTTAPIPQNWNTVAFLICIAFMAIFGLYDLVLLIRGIPRGKVETIVDDYVEEDIVL